MNLYALPVVGRAGLGNMLFPWARAEIFARSHRASVLAPLWSTPRIGPYLRREPVKRTYLGYFKAPHHLRGIARLVPRYWGKLIPEAELGSLMPRMDGVRPKVVVFRGLEDLFRPLLVEQDFVRTRLWEMTRPELRSTAAQHGGRFIAMHIRRGDITRASLTREQLLNMPQFTPISWFASMARMVRSCREFDDLPIVVFTDGSRDEVSAVLDYPDVRLHTRRAAISDMWTLAHAALLFASGNSTFSMWASFLGQMPTVYAPAKLSQMLQPGEPGTREIELPEGGELPDVIRARVGSA